MTDRISAKQFRDAEGVEDWRTIVGGGWACAYFRTGSFAVGVELVRAIGEIAAAANHHPDVDLRPKGVSVKLFTSDFGGLSQRDVAVAQQISVAAAELGAPADPSGVQHVQVAIDAMAGAEVLPFWAAVLGYEVFGEEDVLDPLRRGPTFWFQQMDAPRPQRNRFHIDVYLPHDHVEARIAAALAAGGRIVNDANAPGWWTLADPEGNEVDLAIWE
ncbi:VOC family protein [Actinospica robiniae]|uniref:VOC family protein n=1 Tax=Actinospica robiniae TaxID=304901 RepID=UPI0004176B57|nr:VOC family protein [Actinospica robiniae]